MSQHVHDDRFAAPGQLRPLADVVAETAANRPEIASAAVSDDAVRVTFQTDVDRVGVRRALRELDVTGVDGEDRPVELSFDPVYLAPHRLRLDPAEPVHFVATCEVVRATG